MADVGGFPITQGKPLGYIKLSVGTDTKFTGGTAPPAGAAGVWIAVGGADIRFRDDGTAPTTAEGFPVASGNSFTYAGNPKNLSFTAQSGSPILYCLFYG